MSSLMRSLKRALLTVAAFAATWVGGAAGQACLGVPTTDGQFSLSGGIGFSEGAKSYGGAFSADLVGPVSIGLGYELIDIDDISTNGNAFSGRIGFELAIPGVSMCPFGGASYARLHEEEFGVEATLSQVGIPIGMGIGKTFDAGSNLLVTLFGAPQFLYINASLDASGPGGSLDISESNSEFALDMGVRFGTTAFFAGAGVGITTIEDSDPVFGITVGVLLGRRGE